MDPYLEGEMWQEFHDRLANQISAQLMPLVAPRYVALLGKKYVFDRSLGIHDLPPHKAIYPDVHVAQPRQPPARPTPEKSTLTISEPAVELPNLEEISQLTVEIRDLAGRQLVTLIEILSPANKIGEGARDYEEKRLELLKTKTHLLEIDLLRRGQRIQLVGAPPVAHYYAYLSRVQRRPNTQVWAISLDDRLPTIPVPLLKPDPDVPLDLQAALNACFDLVGYERLLDYRLPPPPPDLPEAAMAWVRNRLKSAGCV